MNDEERPTQSNPFVDVEVAEGLVWCDNIGDVHSERDEDPERNGPRYLSEVTDRNGNLEENWYAEVREDYGSQELAFYRCPGEHSPIVIVRQPL